MRLGLELFCSAGIPALAMAVATPLVASVRRASANTVTLALVWTVIVAAVFYRGAHGFLARPSYQPGVAFMAIGLCASFSLLFLLRAAGVLGASRATGHFEIAQRRMEQRRALARKFGISVSEVMQREKAGEIHLEE